MTLFWLSSTENSYSKTTEKKHSWNREPHRFNIFGFVAHGLRTYLYISFTWYSYILLWFSLRFSCSKGLKFTLALDVRNSTCYQSFNGKGCKYWHSLHYIMLMYLRKKGMLFWKYFLLSSKGASHFVLSLLCVFNRGCITLILTLSDFVQIVHFVSERNWKHWSWTELLICLLNLNIFKESITFLKAIISKTWQLRMGIVFHSLSICFTEKENLNAVNLRAYSVRY